MLTRSKSVRLHLVMRFARWLGVPVDVHGSYFDYRLNSPSKS
jgi:hypothetical protein